LQFARQGDELRLRWKRDGETQPEEEAWTRWATTDWPGDIVLVPALPDRLVVVKPDEEFRLLQGARARLLVRVPLWLEVRTRDEAESAVVQIPTAVMSDTWWGTLEEGELGYWLPTRGRRKLSDADFQEHLCICPLQLENRSGEDLRVDKIALRMAHLSLYRQHQRFWSDVTRVRYLGEDTGSRLDIEGRPPAEAADAELLTEPRVELERGFTARTFARLRSSFGGWR